jgi:lysophospholipase L1-like esterase
VFVSIKPSPSRKVYHAVFREANDLIRKYIKKKRRASFVDVYSSMIDDEGKPLNELFLEDMLHMNAKGYAIWQKLIQPHLIK